MATEPIISSQTRVGIRIRPKKKRNKQIIATTMMSTKCATYHVKMAARVGKASKTFRVSVVTLPCFCSMGTTTRWT